METALVDVGTGEVINQGLSTDDLELFFVPEDVDSMIVAANSNQKAAEGHHWRTAAMVYAWTYDTGGGRPKKSVRNGTLLTIEAFAALGIRGLTKRDTVAKYRAAMQRAIDERICDEPRPGEGVVLPAIEFTYDRLSLGRHGNLKGEYEWYTPSPIIDASRNVMGGIDLDPASCEHANEVVKAAKFYTEEDDGLKKDWAGRVFLNPPFAHPTVKFFAEKLIESFAEGKIDQAIWLSNACVDVGWWQDLASIGITCFHRGRIKFYGPDGKLQPPTLGQSITYLGDNKEAFEKEFIRFGVMLS